jgi:hypothetical protein
MGAWMTPGILNSTSYTLVIAGAFGRIVTSFAALPRRNISFPAKRYLQRSVCEP